MNKGGRLLLKHVWVCAYVLFCTPSSLLLAVSGFAVVTTPRGSSSSSSSSTAVWAANKGKKSKGGGGASKRGGGGFGAPAAAATLDGTAASPKTADKSGKQSKADAAETKRVLGLYGGDVRKGTMARIAAARAALERNCGPLAEAMTLTEERVQWEATTAGLSILQQSDLPPQSWEAAKRRNARLATLEQEHNVSKELIHNMFQKITWDASAEAKALRAKGELTEDIQTRLDRALAFATEPLLFTHYYEGDEGTSSRTRKKRASGRICDVGAGTGALIPELQRAGIPPSCIVGVDISSEMTRVARDNHPHAAFVTSDFLLYDDNASTSSFDTVLFCMSLHDLPDPLRALRHAVSLLGGGGDGGRIVVAHPRGGAHVRMQHRRNPIMVPHELPTAAELERLCADYGGSTDTMSLKLTVAPCAAGHADDARDGYLAVLDLVPLS